MRSEFIDLAKGNEELSRWFSVVHCSDCEEFTLQPYFFGCKDNHTFCEMCTVKNLIAQGDHCVKCSHKISTIDGTTFYPHARALLNLLYVKNPDKAKGLEDIVKQDTEKDPRSGEAFLQQILTITLENQQYREMEHEEGFGDQHLYPHYPHRKAPKSSDWTWLSLEQHRISTRPN